MEKFLLLIMPIFMISGLLLTFNANSNIHSPELHFYEKENKKISYSINNNMSYSNTKYSERGVYYDTLNQINAPHFYTIAMGEKSTGGYSITVQTVNIDEQGNVEVIVNETTPGSDSIVTLAFTYPTCMVTLDKLPNNIVVKNTEGKLFKKINL